MPTHSTTIARHAARQYEPNTEAQLEASARGTAQARHPHHAQLQAAVDTATQQVAAASRAHADAQYRHYRRLERIGPLALTIPAGKAEAKLAELDRDIAATTTDLDHRHHAVARSRCEPAILALPPGRLDTEHAAWAADRDQRKQHDQQAREQAALGRVAQLAAHRSSGYQRSAPTHSLPPYTPPLAPGPSIGL